jgi:3-deoxy-7-phosphoheptulonate synthase
MIANPPSSWRPDSWQTRPAAQQPGYPDRARLDAALEQLRHLPPLVTSWEVNALKAQLAEAQEGRRFVLQGGDCTDSSRGRQRRLRRRGAQEQGAEARK